MSKLLRRFSIVFCFLFAFILVGCEKKEAENGKPVVYASFYPVYDLVHQVAGDTVNLKTFMPIDKDPHLWEPTAKDLKQLSKADLLVVNGANMERWLDKVRESLPNLDVLVLSDSVRLITYKGAAAMGDFQYLAAVDSKKGEKYKINFGHTHEDLMRVTFIKDNGEKVDDIIKKAKKLMETKGKLVHQKDTINVEEGQIYALEMGHESGKIYYELPSDGKWYFVSDRVSEPILTYRLELGDTGNVLKPETILDSSTSGLDKITYDPHSWLSIDNSKKYINAILDKLVAKYPKNTRVYRKNKLHIVDALTTLERDYKEKFKTVKNKDFVVTHHAYEYLSRDFGLRQFALQGLISTETPSLKTIKKALNFCKKKGINTIFYEYGGQKKGADTLATELGGKSVGLASMEYITPENSKDMDYLTFMKMNLENIYQSLK